MKLSEFKEILKGLSTLMFVEPSGEIVPEHFHVTEVGVVSKHFIDCGGTVRSERVASFQLWKANDYDHRLAAQKLLGIIGVADKNLSINGDLEVEVEYQGDTIGKYGLEFNKDQSCFWLTSKQTDCLAKDKCGIEVVQSDCCSGSGCC